MITPTNSNYNKMTTDFGLSKSEALTQQTEWERTAMHCASAIVFWIPRSEKNPARTTNIEFGEWYKKNNVFVGWPDGAVHNEYIELKLNEQNKKRFSSLKDALKAAVSALNRPGTMFFTSDTHFSQKRTLELSRRPFIDVKEMDLTLISNWNKTVTMNDVVYHAGDFIDPDKASKLKPLLDNLNFKELHWICGNYDRYILSKIEHLALNYDRRIYIHSTAAVVHVDSVPVGIVHEPIDPGNEYMSRKDFFNAMTGEDPKIFLYGHIHGRSFAKKNGIDLASDYHRYTPLSLDDVNGTLTP